MRTHRILCLLTTLFAGSLASSAEPLDTKRLAEIAARHRVPMPPKEARLVLAHTESWSVLGGRSTSRDPGIYSPAFLLEEEADGGVVILRGMERRILRRRYNGEPLWRTFSTEHVEPKLGGYVVAFDRLSAFVCSVQSAASGDDTLAQRIWRRFAAAEWWGDGRIGEDGARQQLKDTSLLFARCIFDYLRDRLLEEQADWRGIHARMKALFDEFPGLKNPERNQLYDDLSIAISAKPPASNSVEALLLDWARRPSNMRHLGLFRDGKQSEADASAREIVLRGFDVVPELLALLDDRRITAHNVPAFMRAPARIRRVGELAGLLLQEIAGTKGSFYMNTPPDPAALRAWWRKSREQGEQDFLAGAVFERKGEKITWVNDTPARILERKFPERLPVLCEEFSKHAKQEAQPYALANALATSRLPKEVRVKVLSEFAQRGSLEHRRCVLSSLGELDKRKCAEILGTVLKNLPKDPEGSYWTCPEAGLTHVVMQIEDDRIWREYLRVAKRSSIGLRMEMMNPMTYSYVGNNNRGRRLAFLAAFLDDDAVREMSAERGKFDGPCAAFTIPRIEVRDFAAMQTAWILGLEDVPDEFWTADRWTKLREKVRKRLAGENLPNLGTAQ